MERKYSDEQLSALRERETTVTERGLPIVVKPIPDCDIPGAMDPRLLASMAPMFKGIKGMIAKTMMKKMMEPKKGKSFDAKGMRKMMNGVKSIPITTGVLTRHATVQNGDYAVPIRIYTPEQPKSTPQPVFYYIHGGGFAAGSPDVVEEMCKLVVARTGYASVSVDYRLVPENPYPEGQEDCYAVLKWIAQHAAEFGGDAARICISGDSAGGNLATVCAMRDRDDNGGLVKLQALIYPTVNMAKVEDEEYHFSMDEFEILPENREIAGLMINMFRGGDGGTLADIMGPMADAWHPYLSPYLGDLKGMPPCIILYGEHDYLRIECESYARKLQKAGVPVKAVRYRGLSHGFADVVGGYPQAEDCMNEISDFMVANF